ncbi:MAG: RHS repeat-associated core domain-containing protein [Chloroflexi bacterium]|nr:RHS repeat-associated core domain-containing protein [Chloroflexota bacterium]
MAWVVCARDGGREVETTSTYNPYGTILAQTGTSSTVYGYTGEQEDSATGLVYLRARYYNPTLQVFMGKDPCRGDKMRPMTQHGYAYGYNSPPNFNDPSGLCVPEGDDGECLPPDRDPYGLIEFGGEPGERETWTSSEKYEVNRAAIRIGKNLADLYNDYMFGLQAEMSDHFAGNDYLMSLFDCGSDLRPLSIRQAFLLYYGKPTLFYKTGELRDFYGHFKSANAVQSESHRPTPRIDAHKYDLDRTIDYHFDGPSSGYRWATHELGHYFEWRVNDIMGSSFVRNQLPTEILNRRGFVGVFPGWVQSTCDPPTACRGEIFADMFLGWNYETWDTRKAFLADVKAKIDFMDQYMAPWIALVINREKRNTQ